MQCAHRTSLMFAFLISIFGALCAVTPRQMVKNLDWFMAGQVSHRLYNQITGIFLTFKQREGGHLDLRSQRKKKIRVRLARLRGQFENNSIDYKAIVAAWHLANHYSMVYPKASLVAKKGESGLDNKEEDQCLICFEAPQSAINTLCGHTFCAQCLLEWFAQKPQGSRGTHTLCPYCRSDFGFNLKIFLQNHSSYAGLAQENYRSAQEVDYRELASAQSAFDEEYIREFLSPDELAQLIQLQEELDAQKNKSSELKPDNAEVQELDAEGGQDDEGDSQEEGDDDSSDDE